MNILIIEDQEDLNALIADHLNQAGIKTQSALTGEQALNLVEPDRHDLIILDRGLPDMEGLELLKILRDENVRTPVLILTAKDGLGDKVAGLNSGADDYLVKPFEMAELVARIHALHRRSADIIDTVIKMGNLEFHPAESLIKMGGMNTELTSREQEALERLMRLPSRVVSKDMLLSALYGHGEEGSYNSVEVVMHRLRKKLEEVKADVEIKTLRGIGYLMKEKQSR